MWNRRACSVPSCVAFLESESVAEVMRLMRRGLGTADSAVEHIVPNVRTKKEA